MLPRPFFAGVTVFFVDPPELDMDFTGAADFVDLPVLRQVVRSTILDAVRGLAVLPARIAVDLNPDDDTDQAACLSMIWNVEVGTGVYTVAAYHSARSVLM